MSHSVSLIYFFSAHSEISERSLLSQLGLCTLHVIFHSLSAIALHVFRLKIIHTCRCLEDTTFCFITQYKVSWNMVSVHCCWSLCGSGQEGSSGQKYFALSLQLASAAHMLMSSFMSLSTTVLLLAISLALWITQSVLFGVISGNYMWKVDLTYLISANKLLAKESPYAYLSFKAIISPKVLCYFI